MDQAERQDTIRAELERRARSRKTITYGELAGMVGLVAQGLGPFLNIIKSHEAADRRPDLGCLVINAATGFPGYVGNGEVERINALELRESVFKAWSD